MKAIPRERLACLENCVMMFGAGVLCGNGPSHPDVKIWGGLGLLWLGSIVGWWFSRDRSRQPADDANSAF